MARRVRTTGSLDSREQSILRAVIEEYVTSAQPVGSRSQGAVMPRVREGASTPLDELFDPVHVVHI